MSENFNSEIERHFCGAVSEPAKTTAVDDARKELPVRKRCPNCGNMTYGECCPEYWTVRDALESAEAQLSEQRTTIERLEQSDQMLRAIIGQIALALHGSGFNEKAEDLPAQVAQLEQDRLKLEGELRQEREAHATLRNFASLKAHSFAPCFVGDTNFFQAATGIAICGNCQMPENHPMHQVAQLQTTISQLTAERNALCLDCVATKRRAYSDASTPGFFFDTCAKHRVATITAKPEGAV